MKVTGSDYFGVELKQTYFEEFIICGIPVPLYSNTSGFILKFKTTESYLNYRIVLKKILADLQHADPACEKYEIQRSKAFIRHVLNIMRTQFAEKHN